MRLKQKLQLSFSTLFLMILILSIMGAWSVYYLGESTSRILNDNYESIEYVQEMQKALEAGDTKTFELFFNKQKKNVTEAGEGELTRTLESDAAIWKMNRSDTIHSHMQQTLHAIQDVNQAALVRKSEQAKHRSVDAFNFIAVLATVIVLLVFTFVLNIPSVIAAPIVQLRNGIRQIIQRNYEYRISTKTTGELGELVDAFNSMAERLDYWEHSNTAQLASEKQRIETIINQMNDAVIGLDASRNILFVNHIAKQLLGLKESDLSGIPARQIAQQNDLMRNLLNEQSDNNLRIVVAGKENFFHKDTVTVYANTEIVGELITLKNITVYKELDVAKTNFIATVSHELKTPISSIKMSLKLLEDQRTGQMNEDQKKLIAGIQEDSDRLLKITSELLNLSQVETGNIQLNIQPADPQAIIQYSLMAVKAQAEQKQVTIAIDAPIMLPAMKADADKTAWVLINFLTNAIRYSSEETTITIKAETQNNFVEISVSDDGKGIETQYLSKIFNRYFQIPGSKPGTGLGLAISKEFIEAQGGNIGVNSEPGKGSRFYFSLPVV